SQTASNRAPPAQPPRSFQLRRATATRNATTSEIRLQQHVQSYLPSVPSMPFTVGVNSRHGIRFADGLGSLPLLRLAPRAKLDSSSSTPHRSRLTRRPSEYAIHEN